MAASDIFEPLRGTTIGRLARVSDNDFFAQFRRNEPDRYLRGVHHLVRHGTEGERLLPESSVRGHHDEIDIRFVYVLEDLLRRISYYDRAPRLDALRQGVCCGVGRPDLSGRGTEQLGHVLYVCPTHGKLLSLLGRGHVQQLEVDTEPSG